MDVLQLELESLRSAKAGLEVQLKVEQRRAQEWYSHQHTQQHPGQHGGMSMSGGGANSADKKRDDLAISLPMYDPESAVLQVRALAPTPRVTHAPTPTPCDSCLPHAWHD